MSNFLYSATEWLSRRLSPTNYVDTKPAVARRWDDPHRLPGPYLADMCICGDPHCDLPWSDGGAVAPDSGEGSDLELRPGEGRK